MEVEPVDVTFYLDLQFYGPILFVCECVCVFAY